MNGVIIALASLTVCLVLVIILYCRMLMEFGRYEGKQDKTKKKRKGDNHEDITKRN